MERYHRIYSIITPFLLEHPKGLTIKDLAKRSGLHRNVLAKYLKVFQAQGKIDIIEIGTARYVRPSNRVPAEVFQKYSSEPVIILDRHLAIVTHNIPAEEILQRGNDRPKLTLTNQDYLIEFFGEEIVKGLVNAIRGIPSEISVPIRSENRKNKINGLKHCIPVVFDNGSPGAALLIENSHDHREEDNSTTIHSYQALFHDHILFMVRFSKKGMISFMNQPFARHLGYDYTQNNTDYYPRFIPRYPEEEYDAFLEHLTMIRTSQDMIQADIRRFLANGEQSIERWNIRGFFEDGNLIEYHGAGLDITSIILPERNGLHQTPDDIPGPKEHSDSITEYNSTISPIQSSMYRYSNLWPRS